MGSAQWLYKILRVPETGDVRKTETVANVGRKPEKGMSFVQRESRERVQGITDRRDTL